MPIDFSSPKKTQLYDNELLAGLRDAQFALASFLDGHAIGGAPAAGIKRYNASSALFERWTGTVYEEMPLAYLKKAGGTLTGALVLADDATANLHAVTLRQMNAALGQKANSSALGNYLPTAGGAISGALAVSGAVTVGGFTSQGNVEVGLGVYAQTFRSSAPSGAGYAFNVTSNGPNQKIWDVVAYGNVLAIRAINDAGSDAREALTILRTGFEITSITFNTNAIARGLTVDNDMGAGYGGGWRMRNGATGSSVNFRVNPIGALEVLNNAYSAVNFYVNDNGDVGVRGKLFAGGGGSGLGRVLVQQGGTPSGGFAGDLWLIYD